MGDLKIASWQKRLGVGVETAYGAATPPAIARYIGFESAAFDFKSDSHYKTVVGVARMDTEAYKREQVLRPSVTIDLQPDNCGEIFASFFGTVTTTTELENSAGTQYRHNFTPAGAISDVMKSILFKLDYGQGTAYDYYGCRASKMTFSVASKENVKLAVDFVGQREVAGTSCPATVKYGTFQPMAFDDMEINIDGTLADGITTLEMTLDNVLSEGFRLGTRPYTTKPLPADRMGNEIKFVNEYNNVDRQRYLGGTAVGITVKFIGQTIGGTGKNELLIRLPKVDYTIAPFGDAEGMLTLAVTGKGLEDGTSAAGTGFGVRYELLNNVVSY